MLLFVLSVLAQPAAACSPMPSSGVDLFPADGATDVVVDARPRVIAGWDDTAGEDVRVRIFFGQDALVGTTATGNDVREWGSGNFTELSLETALEPSTTYQMVVEAAGAVLATSSFTTGAANAGAPGVPELVIEDVINAPAPLNDRNSCDWDHRQLSLVLTPTIDSSEEGGVIKLWMLGDDSDATLPDRPANRTYDIPAGASSPIAASFTLSLPSDTNAQECFLAVHENAAGEASATTALICSGPTGSTGAFGGCSTVGGSAGGMGIGILALLLGMRRRRA